MRYARAAVLGAVIVALASGCGKPSQPIVPVEGVIRLDGQPLKKAAVRFIPKGEYGSEYIAVGVTDDSGHYTLTCKGQPGACAGENQVLVLEAELPSLPMDQRGHPKTAEYFEKLGNRPIPRRYANLVESPLTAKVEAGRRQYDFDLTR